MALDFIYPGANVQLHSHIFPDGDQHTAIERFMRISSITRDETKGTYNVTGAEFYFAKAMHGKLPKKKNEIVRTLESLTVPASEIIGPANIVLTNFPFPEKRKIGTWVDPEERLCCRYFYIQYDQKRKEFGTIRRVMEEEADEGFRMSDEALRMQWRTKGEKDKKRQREEREEKEESTRKQARRERKVLRGGFTSESSSDSSTQPSSADTSRASSAEVNDATKKLVVDLTHKLVINLEDDDAVTDLGKENSVASLKAGIDKITITDLEDDPIIYLEDEDPVIDLDDSDSVIILEEEDSAIVLDDDSSDPVADLEAEMRNISVIDIDSDSDSDDLIIDNEKSTPPKKRTHSRSRYTFGDAFCGGGGASYGALLAGLRLTWAFDMDPSAASTYRYNFPQVSLYQMPAHDFIAQNTAAQVDIVHLSPPCQPFSPAHTIQGKNDERNEASFFAVREVLRNTRPRFATLEETFGLKDERHGGFWNSLLMMFTEEGWSVSFRICNAVEWGVAQRRERLIVVAASPGEQLPPFPPPTHYLPDKPTPDLRPPTTLHRILRSIPPHATEHSPLYFKYGPRPFKASLHHPFPYTIRAGGGEYDVHPNGLRAFTIRELLCLQSFPLEFGFPEDVNLTNKRRVVGNAVPPLMGKAIFWEIRKWMEFVDGRREERKRREAMQAELVEAGIVLEEDEDLVVLD